MGQVHKSQSQTNAPYDWVGSGARLLAGSATRQEPRPKCFMDHQSNNDLGPGERGFTNPNPYHRESNHVGVEALILLYMGYPVHPPIIMARKQQDHRQDKHNG